MLQAPALGEQPHSPGPPRPNPSRPMGAQGPYDRLVRLNLEQGRVVGSLVEKQLTTPQQYPLTLNSLLLACNQTSNREPVLSYDEGLVQKTLASLKEAGIVRFVYPSNGRSATRYHQVIDEALGLGERQLALLAVMLLRGPQTLGELRTRTERMTTFDALGAVNRELVDMAGRAEPLVMKLPRRPGQKEERWAQLLTPEAPTITATNGAHDGAGSVHQGAAASSASARRSQDADQAPFGGDHSSLADEVAALRSEVAELRAAVGRLQAPLERDVS